MSWWPLTADPYCSRRTPTVCTELVSRTPLFSFPFSQAPSLLVATYTPSGRLLQVLHPPPTALRQPVTAHRPPPTVVTGQSVGRLRTSVGGSHPVRALSEPRGRHCPADGATTGRRHPRGPHHDGRGTTTLPPAGLQPVPRGPVCAGSGGQDSAPAARIPSEVTRPAAGDPPPETSRPRFPRERVHCVTNDTFLVRSGTVSEISLGGTGSEARLRRGWRERLLPIPRNDLCRLCVIRWVTLCSESEEKFRLLIGIAPILAVLAQILLTENSSKHRADG